VAFIKLAESDVIPHPSRSRRTGEAPEETTGARIDAALALDELIQRLGIQLVRRVPQQPADSFRLSSKADQPSVYLGDAC
jgi:hypothetical protein